MVGFYQDPDGENVRIVQTGSHEVPRRDSLYNYSPDAEIRTLRQRIAELERNQQPSRVNWFFFYASLLHS